MRQSPRRHWLNEASRTVRPDGDSDGLCDTVDECPGGAPLEPARLIATGFEAPGCYDRLMLEGRLTLSSASEIDPVVTGLRLGLRDAGGTVVSDDVLPAGIYDEGTKTGWRLRARPSGVTWIFSRPKGDGGALGRAVVRRSFANPGELGILLRGRPTCLGAPAVSWPLSAAVVLNPSRTSDDQCGEARFPMATCSAGRHGRIMCER